MAKLAKPKAKDKPSAPKKPSTRSKTGNAACSEAASNWQLSLRGKAALSPDTYQTLAKCRAMNRTAKMAEAQGRTGKLSAMGESAIKARLQSRFDSGLITQKARAERLDMLLKRRSQRGKVETTKPQPEKGTFLRDLKARELKYGKEIAAKSSGPTLFPIGPNKVQSVVARARATADMARGTVETRDKNRLQSTDTAFGRNTKERQQLAYQIANARRSIGAESRNLETQKNIHAKGKHDFSGEAVARSESRVMGYKADLSGLRKEAEKLTQRSNVLVGKLGKPVAQKPSSSAPVLVQRGTEGSSGGEIIPPKPAQPARYSLGGQLAPGRDTAERRKVAKQVLELRKATPEQAAAIVKKDGTFAMPSKYDPGRIAVKNSMGRWESYTPRQLAFGVIAGHTKASKGRLKKVLGRAGL